jgi:hypothetical protein
MLMVPGTSIRVNALCSVAMRCVVLHCTSFLSPKYLIRRYRLVTHFQNIDQCEGVQGFSAVEWSALQCSAAQCSAVQERRTRLIGWSLPVHNVHCTSPPLPC